MDRQGRVRVVHDDYGFLQDDAGISRFFHRSAVHGVQFEEIYAGAHVVFRAEETDRGPRAEDVRLAPR